MAPKKKAKAEEELSEYEKVRQERIQANKARLAELGLEQLAKGVGVQQETRRQTVRVDSSGPLRRSDRLRGAKMKNVEEEGGGSEGDGMDVDSEEEMIVSKKQLGSDNEDEYVPVGDAMKESESESDSTDMSEDDLKPSNIRSEEGKVSKKGKEKLVLASEMEMDEDELNLQEALALSLEQADTSSKRTEKPAKQSKTNRKMVGKTKFSSSQAEVDALYHTIADGRRGLSLRELEQAAGMHNFTWSKQELEEMIYLFDKDNDGTLSLAEFRNVAARCHILENTNTAPLRS